jgi:hypothetical protein
VTEGASASYNISLLGKPKANVVISITPSSSVITVSYRSVLFTPGNWTKTKSITVYATEDAVNRGYTYSATLTHTATSTDSQFSGSAVAFEPSSSLKVTLFDNDVTCYRSCSAGYYPAFTNGTQVGGI